MAAGDSAAFFGLASTPVAEELGLIPHTRQCHGRAKTQDAAQLLADREPLLLRQNHAGMFAPGSGPLRVKPIEIGYVMRVKHALARRGEGQLFLVGLF
jgi:hypothetical protein